MPVKERTKQLEAVVKDLTTTEAFDNERRAQELKEIQRLKRINTLSPDFDNVPHSDAFDKPELERTKSEELKEEKPIDQDQDIIEITSPTDEALLSIAGYVKSMIDKLEHH